LRERGHHADEQTNAKQQQLYSFNSLLSFLIFRVFANRAGHLTLAVNAVVAATMPENGVHDLSGGLAQLRAWLQLHDGLSVVHFWADWAEQCAPMDEAFKILAADPSLAQVKFLRVEAEVEADVSMEYEVAAVPTLLFFAPKGKKILERVEGAKVAEVVQTVSH